MTKRMLLLFCACLLLVAGLVTTAARAEPAFGKQTLKVGATGGDVYELQGRLKYLGFYTGKIDGQFRQRTYRAVRLFQYQFGLKVDGVVGPKTKRQLVDASKEWAPGVSPRIYKKGDRGRYVWELQRRLQYIGFYAGKIDGKFGSQTDRAVRDFQYEFALKVDGRVGPKTKLKLWKATRGWKPGAKGKERGKPPAMTRIKPMNRVPRNTNGLSRGDIRVMSQAVHAEARGEPYVGQVAVAAVILNRLESEKFPDSPAAIIYQPLAFEAVSDGQINMEPNQQAKKAVNDALNGWDPSGGALYYFNPATATSDWIWSRPQIKRIGKHIFTK
ncbi:N-acetylmuramoyl-L-alanine amidase [Melghirimyces profundicolus]|uniref:Spore cortex-lytic enzyme n=1 Tax=Melghirimyces profundicolus TaxID=1242148 RepID=A0A2T6BTE0_9BACL|nr:spore cortex-lytic enzyme [Melghirimyces profundicolus]PTX59309.1 N-acetylmuramoyl-L-alanine amidase [Melghirimyces profundicolus]